MISDRHNFDNGYIGLVNLNLRGLPDSVDVAGCRLQKKSEFHITLMCAKRVADLIDSTRKQELQTELVERFLRYIEKAPLVEFTLTNDFYFVERDERKTLVIMTKVPGLKRFFEELRAEYGVDIPDQPTHITLYTLQEDAGIGIFSEKELGRDGAAVEVSELKEMRVAS